MNDPFKQDILDDALTARQLERKKKREPVKERKAQKEARQKIAEENRTKRNRFAALIFVVLVVLAIIFGKDIKQIIDLTKQKNAAQAQLDSINSRIAQLEDELSRIKSPEYIEQQARNTALYVFGHSFTRSHHNGSTAHRNTVKNYFALRIVFCKIFCPRNNNKSVKPTH